MRLHHPVPLDIIVHRTSRMLEITFDDNARFSLPFELLRVWSPSAEVKGHGRGQETLQTHKQDVLIDGVEPVGHYGIKPLFSDGHVSGIYTWTYLYELGEHQEARWADYLQRLAAAGFSADADDDGRRTIVPD